ncbi:P-loop containing nucleoside triphosphate hydrolase protein [Ostreococcus tauri]|uniref:RNA helicase n=1 Tax=Ostreococcus tauri TaxID=70448 RepID=A0A1Y5I7H1_OSTTA|nr:P-loop containing nucleoside triphosphate hydrolase protein [Ostreococcus tauri]
MPSDAAKKRARADETPEARARRKAAKRAKKDAEERRRDVERDASPSIEAPPTPTLKRVASKEDFRKEHQISIKNACERTRDLEPYVTFDDAKFPAALRKALKAQGYDAPTPIQAEAWPILLKGKDVVAIAKTGSGKTCGFLLPALAKIVAEGTQKAPEMQLVDGRWRPGAVTPSVIVLAPTRELAIQIHDECAKFCPAAGCRSAVLYGGAAKGDQLRALRSGADVVVATPGRLNDFLEPPPGFTAPVSAVKAAYVVLDEADRMLDMGFEPQIKKIFKLCPSARQTVMFTATWPKGVQKIADAFTTKPIHIQIGSGGDKLTANKSITQTVEVVEEEEKFDRCVAILKKELGKNETCIMFAGTKRRCDFLDRRLKQVGFSSAGSIHGDKDQYEREMVLDNFRRGRGNILVATDVAARGLDIPGVAAVIVYDFPLQVEDYVHRIGRTGRAGKDGKAFTFFTKDNRGAANELIEILQGAGQTVPLALQAMQRKEAEVAAEAAEAAAEAEAAADITSGAETPSQASKLHPTAIVDERFAMGRIEIEPLEKRFAEIVDMQPMLRSHERVRHSLETCNV